MKLPVSVKIKTACRHEDRIFAPGDRLRHDDAAVRDLMKAGAAATEVALDYLFLDKAASRPKNLIVILANGPSLPVDRIDAFKNCVTIGVNSILRSGFHPDFLALTDNGVIDRDGIGCFRSAEKSGTIFFFHNRVKPKGLKSIRFRRYLEKDDKTGARNAPLSETYAQGLPFGGTVTYTALNLAYLMLKPLAGIKHIVIFGLDLNNGAHFYSPGFRRGIKFNQYDAIIENLERVQEHVADSPVRIWNANPASAVKCFPFLNPEKFLAGIRNGGVEIERVF